MVAVWLLFTAMPFVVEPFLLHRWLIAQSKLKPEATFKAVAWLHRILLFISLVTVLGAVMGNHGLLFQISQTRRRACYPIDFQRWL